jgi:hypothetical protein
VHPISVCSEKSRVIQTTAETLFMRPCQGLIAFRVVKIRSFSMTSLSTDVSSSNPSDSAIKAPSWAFAGIQLIIMTRGFWQLKYPRVGTSKAGTLAITKVSTMSASISWKSLFVTVI